MSLLLNIRKENHVIPIMLEECKIPDQLTDLTYTDLTDYHRKHIFRGYFTVKNLITIHLP
jgi:hypothetical protein